MTTPRMLDELTSYPELASLKPGVRFTLGVRGALLTGWEI